MHKYLTKEEVEEYWETLIKKDFDLFIYSLSTNNLSKKWQFIFRNKILNLIMPEKVKMGTLEFNKNYCEMESTISKSISEQNYLSIHSVMIRDLIRNLNAKSYCLIIDIDAFPLSKFAVKLSFVLAMLKGINGNIQRTNCIRNGEHLFIGPSYICFNSEIIKSDKASYLEANKWKLNNVVIYSNLNNDEFPITQKFSMR